jgi:hypothetical protein
MITEKNLKTAALCARVGILPRQAYSDHLSVLKCAYCVYVHECMCVRVYVCGCMCVNVWVYVHVCVLYFWKGGAFLASGKSC